MFSRSITARLAAAILGSASLAAAGLAEFAAPASAATLTCGTTLTASVTLTRNLDCRHYNGNALTIEANGVVVNLNGHSILGPGASDGSYAVDDPGYSDVTVKNGTISNFYVAAGFVGSAIDYQTGIVVKNLDSTDNVPQLAYTVYASYVNGASITHVSSSDAYSLAELSNAENSTVSFNRAVRDEYAFSDEFSFNDTWSHNTAVAAQQYGIYLYETTNDIVHANKISGPISYAISTDRTIGTHVTANTVGHAFNGIYSAADNGERIIRNSGTHDGWGIYLYDAVSVTSSHNDFGHGDIGIQAYYPGTLNLSSNVTSNNTEFGVFIFATGGGPVTLSGNRANHNAFGLYSMIATSGLGNRARHNTKVNCFQVHCVAAASGTAGPVPAPVRLLPRPPRPLPPAPPVQPSASRG